MTRLNKKNKSKFANPKLLITPMMDMFTIILIFLLFSFSDKPEKINIDKEINLPNSTSTNDYSKSIKLYISDSNIKIDDKIITKFNNNEFIDNFETIRKPLYNELKALKDNKNNQNDHILFFCDKNISFKTINNIMKTSGNAGFDNFQLAVLQK